MSVVCRRPAWPARPSAVLRLLHCLINFLLRPAGFLFFSHLGYCSATVKLVGNFSSVAQISQKPLRPLPLHAACCTTKFATWLDIMMKLQLLLILMIGISVLANLRVGHQPLQQTLSKSFNAFLGWFYWHQLNLAVNWSHESHQLQQNAANLICHLSLTQRFVKLENYNKAF